MPAFVLTISEIQKHLAQIDWYQFEKFCAAILEAEGFKVDRQGGASPDGGVDLIAQKNQTRTLIQCKHWHTWKIRDTATFDHIILLGDYFDRRDDKASTTDDLIRVAGTILGMKEILGDKLHLLWGNHDLPYLETPGWVNPCWNPSKPR